MSTNGRLSIDDFKPLDGFAQHAKNRVRPKVQYDALDRLKEGLRRAGVQITNRDVRGAHRTLDDTAQSFFGQTRFADMHLRDAGLAIDSVKEFDSIGIYTVKDLANAESSWLIGRIGVLLPLRAALAVLHGIMTIEAAQEGAAI